MKAKEIKVGGIYAVKVSGVVVNVRVLSERAALTGLRSRGSWWTCKTLQTGREITVKSCQRFRNEVKPETVPVAERRTSALRGNWTDEPCWYASVRDAGRTVLVLGPFQTEAACREWAYPEEADGGRDGKAFRLRKAAEKRDPKSWFYAWGMVKAPNGYREGVMNKEVGL